MGLDISAECIEHCRRRFHDAVHAQFIVGTGSDLAAVADRSLDAIWSFDVFVHINRAEIERYADEFARVLKPGAIALIHYGTRGGAAGGWRSNLTAEAFTDILQRRGLILEESLAEWSEGAMIHKLSYEDRIAVIRNR